jgi:signal transduction histidine kinase
VTQNAPNLRVLIIDDEQDNRTLLEERLQDTPGWNISTATAQDGQGALNILRESLFDVAFLDYKLPDTNGIDLLKQIRQMHPRVAVVLMSAWGNEKVAVEAMRLGAIDYLVRGDLEKADFSRLLRRAIEVQDLHSQNAELRQVNSMKDEFISSVSHELRTPLAVILGYAKTLEDGELGELQPPQIKAIEAIRRRGERLLEMLNRLLSFKESAQGQQQAVLRPLDLTVFLQERLGGARSDMAEKQMLLEKHIPQDPLWALADQTLLGEVLDGLLSNAVKFSPEKTVINVNLEKRPNGEIWLRIRDEGRGIPQDALPRLFEGFFHTDSDLTREVSGLGIGLALAKQIIELHGGRIWIESEGAHTGSIATVSLPMADPDSKQKVVERSPKHQKKSVLVIEDNEDIVEIIRLFLAGFSDNIVLTTTDRGQEGLDLISKHKYDLLVLDLIMPGISGFDILERMHNLPEENRPPTLILSGHAEAAKRAVQNGARAYLMKPFTKEAFIQSLLELLGMERRKKGRGAAKPR